MRKTWLAFAIFLFGYLPALVPGEDLSRQQIYDNFAAAYQAGELVKAREWAVKLIEAKEAELGAESPELIVSLINLAGLELQLKDWTSAQATTERAIAILDEQGEPEFAHRMELMLLRAKVQLGWHEDEQARATVNDALAINAKNRPVDKWYEAELYWLLVEVARREQHERSGNQACTDSLKARTEYFGKASVDLVPFIEDAADWYRASNQLSRERKLHEQSIAILVKNYGATDERLAEPLRDIASTYTISRKNPDKAREALERAANLEFGSGIQSVASQALVQAELGDYHVVFGDAQGSAAAYGASWNALAAHAELGAGYANRFFSEVSRLYYQQPDAPANTTKGADYFTEGYVLTQFTVETDGSLSDITIVESVPVEMQERLFVKALEQGRFRPRVVDGEPVTTPRVQMRNNYGYARR